MNLQRIAEHTVDVDLLTPGGLAVDAGCRNFAFARALRDLGCHVIAIDADPEVTDPDEQSITFVRAALTADGGPANLILTADPQARHLSSLPGAGGPALYVPGISLLEVLSLHAIADVIKLDIEGAEYDILRAWPGPVARQISVEFHEHVARRQPSVYAEIFKRLEPWYTCVQHELKDEHCAGPNFWDSLWVLK
jgi:hypothetical protein